ncbi:YigZ family protein [Methylomonas paludis]|uniref:YigZ family protein n=1 Tax=Methylomonas paludis TaxID=1173101 RepID=A0A975MLE5_9GAMM|nr:YigZ family protein [Methylomonas paludis]QWF69491.1 YigZ family protein [Methylomonas paludis]
MKLVLARVLTEEYIKKSRFIGVISPCADEAAALAVIKNLHVQHPDASHIVYAYRVQSADGLVCRFYDDGEPGGTAGKPIFQHLEGKHIINVVLAVIRYFGGVKLGAGGLTRAYGNLAKQVIEIAELQDYVEYSELLVTLDYPELQALEYQLKKCDGQILTQEFAEKVRLRIKLPAQHLAKVTEFLAPYPQKN